MPITFSFSSRDIIFNVGTLSAVSLALQHREVAKSEPNTYKWLGHIVLFVCECIPLLGILAALVERAAIRFFKESQSPIPSKLLGKIEIDPEPPIPSKLLGKIQIDPEPPIPPELLGKIEIDPDTATVNPKAGVITTWEEQREMRSFEYLLKCHKYGPLSQRAFASQQEIDRVFKTAEALEFAAEVFFRKYTAPSDLSFSEIGEYTNYTALFKYLLNRFSGICIGEYHQDSSQRYILTRCMPLFKQLGVTTLYIEGFFGLQNALDTFFFQSSEEIPQAIMDRIKISWDYFPDREHEYYQSKDVLIAAKRAGIRIINMDLLLDNPDLISRNTRISTMNFYAKKVIDLDRAAHPGKCIVYSGFGHTARMDESLHRRYKDPIPIKSLAQMYQFPAITILDDRSRKPVHNTSQDIEPNYRISKGQTVDNFHHDFIISMAKPFK